MGAFTSLQRKNRLTSLPAAPTYPSLRPSRTLASGPTPVSEQTHHVTQAQLEHAARFGHSFERVSLLPPVSQDIYRQKEETPRDSLSRGLNSGNQQDSSIVIQRVDDKETFQNRIKPHLDEILVEKGASATEETLYTMYLKFVQHVDLTTEEFAILLKAKNVNPGGLGGPAASRSLLDLEAKVLPVIAQKAEQINILRINLRETPIGASVNFNALLKKIGEGDIQTFKLDTLVQEIMNANDLFELMLKLRKRIDDSVLKSFFKAYTKSIEQAESKVLKKLNRELNAAIAILTHDKSVTLKKSELSYKIPELSENAEFDLLFGVEGSEHQVLVEVQSVPDKVWGDETSDNLIKYLVTIMFEKRERLSLVQKKYPELMGIPLVLMFTRPLPPILYDALNKSGMFIPVLQETQSLTELIDRVVVELKLGTEKSKGKPRRLAIKQEEVERE